MKKYLYNIAGLITCIFFSVSVWGQTVETFTASTSWICPAGVTSVTVECWGGGAGGVGGVSTNNYGGGGGGGGAFASSVVTVIPGNSYTITVGNGGGSNTAGGNTSFATSVIAVGGSVGSGNSGGSGGLASASTGLTKYNGGNGGTGITGSYSGGGGGGAGSTAIGGSASGSTAGLGGSALGGAGGAGGTTAVGNPGLVYGGGAAGCYGKSKNGGTGAKGYVRLTYSTCGVISAFPWTENFDAMGSVGNSIIPSCWKIESASGTPWNTGTAASISYNDPASAANYLYCYYSPTSTDKYVITPAFTLTSGVSYDFSFKFAGDGYSGWTGDVRYNTTQTGTGATLLGSEFVSSGTTTTSSYNTVTRTFVPGSTGTYYFIIRVNNNVTPYYLGFDDFRLELTPTCVAPGSLSSSSVTYTSATISWVAPGSGTPSAYQWEVRTSGAAGSGATGLAASGTTTHPTVTANVTGLSGATTYTYYVRTDCGGGDYSSWSGSTFNTLSCDIPTSVTTSSVTNNSATISWTAPASGTPAGYEYEVRSSGTAGSGATGLAASGTTTSPAVSANVSGLTSATTYSIYVRTTCYAGFYSAWTSASTFLTACDAFTPTYTQDFASYLPTCWSETTGTLAAPVTTSGTSSSWVDDGFANGSSTGSARLNIYGTGADEWLISPSIDLGDGSTPYQLEFDLALTDYGSSGAPDLTGTDDKFAVVISTDNGATWSSANTLQLWNNSGSPSVYNNISLTGEKIIINLSAYTGIVKFGFYGESTVSNADNDLFVDNFRVIVVPACPQPTVLTATNILPDQADLGWTENSDATVWDIEFGADGFSPTGTPTANNVTSNPYTYTGLTASTAYDYYVRANCGGSDGDSEWSGPYSFTSAAPYMTYSSVTTTQTVTTDISPSSVRKQIIGVEIVTAGSTSPISATSFTFNTDGCTSASTDILNAKLWYTGTSSTFATTAQYGSAYAGPNGSFIINGTQALESGTNYFWLTYDISTGAILNDYVDAECNQVTVAAVNHTPAVQDPAGTRQIKDIYLISDPSDANVCSGTFLDSGGAGDYTSSESYTRTFIANTPGSVLQFVFTSFATESGYDYLYVYDGPDNTYPQITGSPFNGTTGPGTIVSNSQYMTFKFTSDGSGVNTGWSAIMSCVPMTAPDCAVLISPASAEVDVCPGTVNLNWSEATTGFNTEGYKLYFGTDNPPTNIINGADIGDVNTYALTNLDGNTTFRWRIEPYNSAGSNTTCAVRSFTTLDIGITSVTGATTCNNTATISATGNGTITWYDVPTGGSPIGTGASYNATFSGNTTYYVAAEAAGGGTEFGGCPAADGGDGSYITTDWGIIFDVTEDVEIVSTTIYPTGTGTVTIALLNDAGTEIAATSAINVTGSGLSTPVVVPLGFDVSAGTNYKIVLKAYSGVTNLVRDFSASFPYDTPSGSVSVTGGWSGSSGTTYYWFYNLEVTSGCISAREPVQVIHTADPITITAGGPLTFLDGGSVSLSASSAASPGYTYTWSPATGLNTTTGANVTASPNTTTTYTVTGTNGSCTNTKQVTVTVTYPCTGLGTGYTIVSSLPYNETSTTCGAVNDITGSNAVVCSSSSYYDGEDVVYSFIPSSNGLITIDLASTGTYTGVMLYEGCPMTGQGGSCVAYSQSSTGAKSLCVNLQQDITYYLIIDSDPSPDCNPYTINISAPDPNGVANDYPCDATPIAIGGLQSGDNSCTSGTDEPSSATCWTTGTLNTVWYVFTAPASGTVKIRTTLGTLTATQIAVYQGNCTNLTVVANSCNVDASGSCSGTTNNSAVELTGLVSGNSYYIRVDGENDLTGDFDIEVIDGINNWPTVPQQDCSSATLICNQQTIVGDPGFLGAGSTCDYTTPYGCFSFGTQNNTVWYQIDIAATGTLIYDIVPNLSTTDYDWALINITGNVSACDQIAAGTLTPVRCNFSGTSGTTGLRTGYSNTSEGASGVPFCSPLSVTAGDSYQLLIWNWSGNNTGFNLDMQATSPVNYSSPTSLTWSGGASTDWFDPINWGGCAIPDCGIDVIIVNGPTNQPVINADGAFCNSISIESGASLTVNAGRTLNICNDLNNIGSLNMDPTSTLLLDNGSADHELNGSLTGSNALGNLTVTKTGGSVTFMQDVEVKGDLITSNETSIINTNGKNVFVGGDFIPWDATYTNIGTGRLTFNGSALQNYSPGGGLILHDVTVNNTGAGVILSRNLELESTGVLTLANGIIDTDGRKVVLNNTDAGAVNSGNTNSYINGDLRRYMAVNTGVYSFPVGTSSAYRLAQIVNNNLSGITYIDGKFLSSFTNTGSLNSSIAQDGGTPYASIAAEGIWQLDPNVQPGSGDYSINLWFDGGGSNAFASLSDNEFGPLKRPSSSTLASDWTAAGGTLNAASTPGRTVAGDYARRNGWTDFSQFAIAKSNVPLPIVLLYFDAKCNGEDIVLNWATAQEINNSYFTILKSTDAKYFYPVAKIDGAGNSSEPIHYSYVDNFSSYSGNIYYKLVQTDFDGKYSESNIIAVNCADAENIEYVRIYNSPDSETLDVHYLTDLESKSYISIIDNLGRILYSTELKVKESRIFRINKSQFAPGIYTIVVNVNKAAVTEQFVIVK